MKKTIAGLTAAVFSLLISLPVWAGEWQQDERGWRYLKDDGTYAAKVSSVIDGERYGFDQDGYMITGWHKYSKGWRYFYSNGTGAKNAWIDGKYYIGDNGVMLTDAWTPDGYYVDSDGVWIEGYKETPTNKEQWPKYYGNEDERLSEVLLNVKAENENEVKVRVYNPEKTISLLYDEDLEAYASNKSYSPSYTLKFSSDGSSCTLTTRWKNLFSSDTIKTSNYYFYDRSKLTEYQLRNSFFK